MDATGVEVGVAEVPEPQWLDAAEQDTWRLYLLGNALLHDRIDRDLREAHDLSSAEYEVLVRLSEAPDRQLRMAELAEICNQSRSRLSHTIDRLQRDGLVTRQHCAADRRGVWAELTEEGFARLEVAARTHVAGVREYLVDAVPPEEFAALGRVFRAVIDRLAPDLPPSAVGTERAKELCPELYGASPTAQPTARSTGE